MVLFTQKRRTAWFLTEEEQAMIRARKQGDAICRGYDRFLWDYAKMAFSDPFICVASIYFSALRSRCLDLELSCQLLLRVLGERIRLLKLSQ
jgi:hypothetical protein